MSNIKFNESLRDKLNKYNKLEYGRVSSKQFQEMVEKLAKIYESKKLESESNKI